MSARMQGLVTLIVVCSVLLYATYFGGMPERVISSILAATYLSDPIYHLVSSAENFRNVDLGHFLFDFLVLGGMIWVGLRANRVWPLCISALQLVPIMGHISMIIGQPGLVGVYWLMTVAINLPILMILLVGTIAHQRRVGRVGSYADWSIR